MSDEKIFAAGVYFKPPHQNAPDFVKGSISIKLADFSAFVKEHRDGEWMNLKVLESRNGKMYVELDTWKPDPQRASQAASQSYQAPDFDDDIGF